MNVKLPLTCEHRSDSAAPRFPSHEDLVGRARELTATLRERASGAEAVRRLPDSTFHDLRSAGFLDILRPARFGGLELGFDTLAEVAMALGAGCTSTAWVTVVLNSAWLVACFPERAQAEVWSGSRSPVIGNVLAPCGGITRVGGGFRVSGTWKFCSGIDFVDWQIVSGMLCDKGRPPRVLLLLLPADEIEIHDDWYALGLRATGSKSIVAREVLIPGHRTLALTCLRQGTAPGAREHANPLYRVPMAASFPLTLASPIVGAAKGTFDQWRTWSQTRVTRGVQRVAEEESTQRCLAEAGAEIDCAGLLLARGLSRLSDLVRDGADASRGLRALHRRDGAYAVELCVRAVQRLFAGSGGHAIFDEQWVQRSWRDVQTASMHVGLRWDEAARTFGRIELGFDFDNPFFD